MVGMGVRGEKLGEVRWTVRARWAWVAMLVCLTVYERDHSYVQSAIPLYAICAIIAGYNLALFLLADRLVSHPERVSLGSLGLDILTFTFFLHFAGDIDNPLHNAYVVPITAGAVMSRRVGYLLALAATVLFSVLVFWVDPDFNPITEETVPIRAIWSWAVFFGAAHVVGVMSARLQEKERELAQENERLVGILEALPVGVTIFGNDGRIALSNAIATALFGSLAGRPIESLDASLGVRERLEGLQMGLVEFDASWRDRVLDQILARISPKSPVVWVVRDSTAQRRLQAHSIHQSKMAEIGLLAAGIAHEIGNPLSSMSALLQLLRQEAMSPPVSEGLVTLGSQVERINRIVTDVTTFARPSTARRTRVAIGTLLEKVHQVFRFHHRSKAVNLDLPTQGGAEVEVVEDQIVQVLLNLLLNASDASPANATVTVRVAESPSEVRVAVSDAGAGMNPQALQHLFTPFYTTKDPGKGVGLGLFVSDMIVRDHGGIIEVESHEGAGSTFTVILPRAR